MNTTTQSKARTNTSSYSNPKSHIACHYEALRSHRTEIASSKTPRNDTTGLGVLYIRHIFWGTILALLCTTGLVPLVQAADLYVGPAETYTTIQAGINAAQPGDTVILRAGTYTGDGNRDIDFHGEAITVRGEAGAAQTIIDIGCSSTSCPDGKEHRGFYFHSGETAASVVDGLTIQHGYAMTNYGGGMFISNASPTITNCSFQANSSDGMYNTSSSPTVTNCSFQANSRHGMFNQHSSSPTVSNCSFQENTSRGMFNSISSSPTVSNCTFQANTQGMLNSLSSSPTITNCTFQGNTQYGMFNDYSSSPTVTNCSFQGNSEYGMYNLHYSSPTVTNSILWGNTDGQVLNSNGGTATFTACDIQGGVPAGIADGGGNFNRNPRFVDPPGDLHLRGDSPCLEAGTATGAPATDMDGDLRPSGAKVDVGADEFTGVYIDSENSGAGDDLPDYWEYYYFGDLTQAPSDDTDYDGVTNERELADGSNPAEAIYVATTGNNANLGRTPGTAKRTIQAGINAAVEGETVIVQAGTYSGSGNKNLNFHGKAIMLRSESGDPDPADVIIDCQNDGRGFIFENYETADAVVDRFTIQNGNAEIGGGMLIQFSDPTINNCIFDSNTATNRGDGIYIYDASPTISNCTFQANRRDGMYNTSSSPTVSNCTFRNNYYGMYNTSSSPTVNNSTFRGNSECGMFNSSSSPTITNCTFQGNLFGMDNSSSFPTINNCTFQGNSVYGMDNYSFSSPRITNCTFQGNLSGMHNFSSSPNITNSILWDEVDNENSSTPTFTYCDIQGSGGSEEWDSTFGTDGGENIDVDPLFVNSGDHPLLLAGNSPCVDAGKSMPDIYSDIRGFLRPVDGNFSRGGNPFNNNFDMGAYEYSGVAPEAHAFEAVSINSSLLIPHYEYAVSWKNKTPFPDNDLRIMQAGNYKVRFVLIGAKGRREVGTATVPTIMTSPDGYTAPITFMGEHVGQWTLRVELADDRTQYADAASPITIQKVVIHTWVIGEAIIPPPERNPAFDPKRDQNLFYWDALAKVLYAIAPGDDLVLTWYDAERNPLPVVGTNVWPMAQQHHVANSAPVDLLPDGSPYSGVNREYTESGATIQNTDQFTATTAGHSVLRYLQGTAAPHFVIVNTVEWDDPAVLSEATATIGAEITSGMHDNACGNGFVFNQVAPYALRTTAASMPADGYDRATRSGPIVPVNLDAGPGNPANDLVVIWYEQDIGAPESTGVCWPYQPARYTPQWPSEPTLVLGDPSGSGTILNGQTNMQIYAQDNPALPGYNPNEEHALIDQGVVYALRNDLNALRNVSEPYVIVKSQNPAEGNRWEFRVFRVVDGSLTYTGTAGQLVQLPLPLNKLPICPETTWQTQDELLWWKDYDNNPYSRKAGTGTLRFYYPLQTGFFYDFNNDGAPDEEIGTCIPWLDRRVGGEPGTPVDATYQIEWPTKEPELVKLNVGDSLISSQDGLEINGQCSVEIIYDESEIAGTGKSVKLLEATSERKVALGEDGDRVDQVLPDDVRYQEIGGGQVSFPDLPPHLYLRLFYDYVNHHLIFRGYFDDTLTGDPLLLPNIMTETERDTIQALTTDNNTGEGSFVWAVGALHNETRGTHLDGEEEIVGTDVFKILSAAASEGGSGYVTVAFNNDAEACAGNPVGLKVIQVGCAELYPGEIKRLYAQNVFDERVTFIHSNDFAGNADALTFEWRVCTTEDSSAPPMSDACWQTPTGIDAQAQGANYYTLGGVGLQVLEDKWVSVRYRGYTRTSCDPDLLSTQWSAWAEPVFYENWVKRVLTAINPFDQRVQNFHENEAATYVSMIQQAGPRYEGDVALNYDAGYLDSIGLIELYTTVLNRAKELSINGSPPQSTPASNDALLFAASRIADLYTLLGNEAYGDASDPTIGFTTDTAVPGTAAPSIFCFQNQVDSLLQEELELLRGRDNTRTSPALTHKPVYNRLIWNFTSGDGEVAYANNYVVEDEAQAKILYPQGHGDAWGHYLTAIKTYYKLLWDAEFDWIPRAETIILKGVDEDVSVDFLDERKFAGVAAAKARTAAEIVNLTYRDAYIDDPQAQWQGYHDSDPERAWGLSEWAIRAGQGTYFDWVVANAILPDEDTVHTGIQKIDRRSVTELTEIASHFTDIQDQLDQADLGLNPLGVAKDALPFDIDPQQVDAGKTHFEQIYDRALQMMKNAMVAFNHANQYSQLLRHHQDTLETFQQNSEDREADFNSRLIEVFGYPYPDDPAYPAGYDGPDLYHYMYVDPSEFLGIDPAETLLFNVEVTKYDFEETEDDGTILIPTTKTIPYHLSLDGLGFVKPTEWTQRRRAPGEIQMARSDLLVAKTRLEQAIDSYNGLIAEIEYQADMLEAQYNLKAEHIKIMNRVMAAEIALDQVILANKAFVQTLKTTGNFLDKLSQAQVEALPKVTGMIAGLANGVIGDFLAPIRGAVAFAKANIAFAFSEAANCMKLLETGYGNAKNIVEMLGAIDIQTAQYDFEIAQKLAELKIQILNESTARYEISILLEETLQAAGRYQAALAKGERLWQDRLRYRQRIADDIREYRYKDMAFRIFRNAALQKYRAQFDMAAMYTYLAAKAYDYETGLLSAHSRAGERFFTDIVKQRLLGEFQIMGAVVTPIIGSGLADQLAQMSQNFLILKGQMGFNNPQIENTRFSVREELFRILGDASSDAAWQTALGLHYVANLWDLSEFRRYCRPFAAEDPTKPEPALVIPFETNITSGLNFFGFSLSGGDSYYDASRFATKIRSVGVWFENYNSSSLAQTPRIYFVPVGEDIIRTPYSSSFDIRGFSVVDQIIPMPFPLTEAALQEPDWTPLGDLSDSDYLAIRRYSRMRAYHDGGTGWENELQRDSRLIGRSVWNGQWLLIIPGSSLSANPDAALDTFINSVTDILFTFQTYSYEGYRKKSKEGELIPE